MLDRDPFATEFLQVDGTQVTLKNHEKFAAEIEEAKIQLIQERSRTLERQDCRKNESTIKRLSELDRLWIKHNKKLILHGVAINDEIYREEPTKPSKWEKLGRLYLMQSISTKTVRSIFWLKWEILGNSVTQIRLTSGHISKSSEDAS